MKGQLIKLVEAAIKAPSVHNTQPWRFQIGINTITIEPDTTRKLKILDADGQALYSSLGCALENIFIAATHHELASHIHFDQQTDNRCNITIGFTTDESVKPDDLWEYIDLRQTNRSKYAKQPISKEAMARLQNAFHFDGIDLKTLTTQWDMERATPYILDGCSRQFEDKHFVEELTNWMRFSHKEALATNDGLCAHTMGMPAIAHPAGRDLMRNIISAQTEIKRWQGLIKSSAGMAILSTRKNDAQHWILLGRAFQRFSLTATQLNISHAPINMGSHFGELRKGLTERFSLTDQHPLLMVRLGYAPKMPHSRRRPSNETITNLTRCDTLERAC